MISAISTRQLVTIVAFGFAVILELFCAIVVFRRDPHYQANRFTSLAYLSFSIALLLNVIYVFIIDPSIVAFLHRLTLFFSLIAVIFLFLASVYISEGSKSLQSYRMMIIIIDSVFCLSLLFSPDVIVFTGETALPGSEQFIEWGGLFFLLVAIPTYLTLLLTCYYYQKVYFEVPSNSPIKRASSLIIIGTIILMFSHFLIVVPHILRTLITEISTLVLISNIGSVGVPIGSIFIFWGYQTKISEKDFH